MARFAESDKFQLALSPMVKRLLVNGGGGDTPAEVTNEQSSHLNQVNFKSVHSSIYALAEVGLVPPADNPQKSIISSASPIDPLSTLDLKGNLASRY